MSRGNLIVHNSEIYVNDMLFDSFITTKLDKFKSV